MEQLFLDHQHGHRVRGDLGCAARVQDDSCEGVNEELAVVAAKQGVRQKFLVVKGGSSVELFAKRLSAALALTLAFVERLECAVLGGKCVSEPFDELQMKTRIKFFEDRHKARG